MSSESDKPDLQKAQTFFQYGNDAALKSNFDYAIDMYKQALQDCARQPGVSPGVAGRRAAQVQRRSRARSGCWSGPRISRS